MEEVQLHWDFWYFSSFCLEVCSLALSCCRRACFWLIKAGYFVRVLHISGEVERNIGLRLWLDHSEPLRLWNSTKHNGEPVSFYHRFHYLPRIQPLILLVQIAEIDQLFVTIGRIKRSLCRLSSRFRQAWRCRTADVWGRLSSLENLQVLGDELALIALRRASESTAGQTCLMFEPKFGTNIVLYCWRPFHLAYFLPL